MAISACTIRTPINTSPWSTPEAYESLITLIPYKHIGKPDDIEGVAVFQATDQPITSTERTFSWTEE